MFDGHLWRRTEPGHKHGPSCGHVKRSRGWCTDHRDPRPYDDSRMDDMDRRDPAKGLYEYGGQTWILVGHVHGAKCFHVLRDGRWYLRQPDD